VNPDILEKYAGIYFSKQIPQKITITRKDSVLIGQVTGQSSFLLEGTENNKFVYDKVGLELEFNTEKDEMILRQSGKSYLFRKNK